MTQNLGKRIVALSRSGTEAMVSDDHQGVLGPAQRDVDSAF